MSKLTKAEIQGHIESLALLERGSLSDADIPFIFENYRESANHINSMAGAFFTPFGLARDLSLHIPYVYEKTIKIVDLCAGIGILSYAAKQEDNSWSRCHSEITCVEINPDYVEIGKKLLPEARWICGDALDPALLAALGHFDCVIANPPYGNIKSNHKKHYSSGLFEYMLIEAAARIADEGIFIIPQMSASFVYSGSHYRRWRDNRRATAFEEKTGIALEFNKGIDTDQYKDDWHGVTPICEIVCCDFTARTGQLSFGMEKPA